MSLARNSIKGIMLVTGAATCTMVYAAIAPQPALRIMFGETLEGPLAEIFVRNWGAVITLQGLLLIWGAFDSRPRIAALMFAIASKLVFVALVLIYGSRFLGHQVGAAIVFDMVCVALFAWYLLRTRWGRA
jgi:hypothetical protein